MIRSDNAARLALAVAIGTALAAPAFAQDATRTRAPLATTTAAPQAPARDEAVKTMPTWDAFGSSDTSSTSETMYRLSRDFLSTQEIGVRRLGTVPIWPRGDLKFGPVRILPYVREGVEYVSNYYREHRTGDTGSPNANDAAWTHTNEAGANADMALAGGRLRLAASVDAEYDVRYDHGNEDRGTHTGSTLLRDDAKANSLELSAQVGASYRFPSGVYIRGGVSYEKRSDPIDVEITRQFKRTNRGSFLTFGLDRDIIFGSKFRFEFGTAARHTYGREQGLDDMNRTEAGYYAKASYPFLKNTTRIFGRARYRQDERDSKRINDGNLWGFDVGMEGSIPLSEGEYRGLRGQVSVGFDSALYESGQFTNGSAIVTRDENRRNTSLAVSAILQYMMSRKSSVDLRYLRTNQFTFHGNYQIVDRMDLTFTHNIGQNLTGRVGTFFEYADPSGRLRQQDDTFSGDTTGDYPATTRFGAGAGLRYRINEWLDADGQYDWERRNGRASFVNHRVSAGVTFYLSALKAKSRGYDEGASLVGDTYTAPAAAPRATAPVVVAPVVKAPATPVAPAAPRVVAPAAPRVAVPAAPAVRSGLDIRSSGDVRVEGGSGASKVGSVVRLRDAAARATLNFADGSSVQVVGPAVIQVVEVGGSGNRLQLVSGVISEARVGAVALEIQTPYDTSLVLQNASASARVAPRQSVSFQRISGEFAKVYRGGSATELTSTAWSIDVSK
ncbi:MAG: hypothetical protein K8T90_11990 [Planctomycetes bacterium]|nr:hypothetical protein [Planctomycetota bacterium]